MKLKGTSKADRLVGTSGDDVVNGGRGNDWIEGGSGNDTLTGDAGADKFVFRSDGGNDVVTDFNAAEGDSILLDSQTGIWDGQLGGHLGNLYAGMEVRNSQDTLVATIHAGDWNGDGVTDTQFVMSSGATLTLLGVSPSDLSSASLFGG